VGKYYVVLKNANRKMHKNSKRKRRTNRKGRPPNGFNLVEVLVSLILGTLISGVCLSLFCELLKLGSYSQNEMCANLIRHQVIEAARTIGYDTLSQHIGGPFDAIPNSDFTATTALPLLTEPLLMDFTNKSWSPTTVSSKFTGTAEYSIAPVNGAIETLAITVVIHVPPSGEATSGRTITTSTVVTKSGIDRWTR